MTRILRATRFASVWHVPAVMVRSARRAGPALIALVLALSAAQLYAQYRAQVDESAGIKPLTYIEQVLGPRHDAVLDHTVGDPWRFRLLSDWGAEAFRWAARTVGASQPAAVGFLAFRFVQNVAIFALAFALYRRLGASRRVAVLGLGLLAWAMSESLLHVQMSFNTYSDIALYFAAALLILDRRYAWIVPLSVIAALNRETGGLIPVMLIAVGVAYGMKTPQGRRAVKLGAIGVVLFAATYAAIRLAVGPGYYILGAGNHPGFELLRYNLGRGITYDLTFQTVNIVPLLAILSWRRWPLELKAFGLAVVPVWVVIHLFTSVLAETRLLLVPFAVVLLPGALLAVAQPAAVRGFAQHGSRS
jgi:hypothetical protein